ncbi:MAG TPA: ester cyclase [Edaphobacter sp.]|nr:ester cyclase [Edaphobacter sp.]
MANVIDIAKAAVTAYNEKDWSKGKDILAANAVYDEKGTHRRIQGAGEIIEAWQGWANAFPDSKATFVREFASGDTVVLELVWKGIHTGLLQTPTGTIPPSNKPIEMPACQVVQVEGGKVKSASHYFDMLTMLTQIGATAAVKTAA